jgi:ectoine hydroxylase
MLTDCTQVRPETCDDIYRSRVDSTPALIPRKEQVARDRAGAAGPLSAAQCMAFDRHGYIELDNWLEPAELASLLDETDRLIAPGAGLQAETLILEPRSTAVRSVFHIHEQSRLFRRLTADSRLVGAARQLLADDVYIHQSRLNYKPGFSGKDFYWHSDFETWHVEDGMPRMRALSMSIALTSNTEYNGPLMVMPGSHMFYVRCVGATPDGHYKQSLRRQEYGIPDQDSLRELYERGGIVAPKGPAGTIVIFDCNIMHGSNSNISPLPRSNVFLVYNSVGNRLVTPYGATRPRPEFIAVRSNNQALIPVTGTVA